MKKILFAIIIMAGFLACSTEEYEPPVYDSIQDTEFEGTWNTDPNANALLETGVRITPDSIIVWPMPDDQIIIETFGIAALHKVKPINPEPYRMRYMPKGYSESMTIYTLDADDYVLQVEEPDGQQHTLTVRFTLDCQASINNYTGFFMMWLNLKAIYMDKEPVDNDRIPNATFTLTSDIW